MTYLAVVGDDDDHAPRAGGHRAGQVLVIFLQPNPSPLGTEPEAHVKNQYHNTPGPLGTEPEAHLSNQYHNTPGPLGTEPEAHLSNQYHNTVHLHKPVPHLCHNPEP